MSGVLILGSGGHAKVIADILRCQGVQVRGFLDDNSAVWGQTRLGLPVLGAIDRYREFESEGLIVGIGANRIRREVVQRLGPAAEALWQNAIHPTAVIADSVRIGRGTVIMANAVINPDTIIGNHAIVNTAATIDHDCTIADYVHTAPGCHLAGGVQVGEGAFLGIGVVVIPSLFIGEWATIGAGAAVVRSIPDGMTAKGVPAR